MRLCFVFVFFAIFSFAEAQFRCANISFFLPVENPSLIVSPLDYNKIGTYVGSNQMVGLQGQVNLNSIYSAVGITSNYMGDKSYATGIQFATHSYLTRQTWHTGAGLQLEWLHDESSISLGSKNQMAWSLGWHVMSNPAGRFLIGANYKNKDLMVLPFERQPITLNQILSCQLGGSIAISRKSSASLLAIFKRCSVQEEQQYWYHVSGNVNFRKWTAGLGWKNWGSGQGMLTRVGLYYRNWMAAYVSTNSNFNFSRNSFLHEISLSKKF